MKKVLIIVVVVLAAGIIGLGIIRMNSNLINMPEPEVFLDSGDENVLNADNKIFRSGYSFVYKVVIIDTTGESKKLCLSPALFGIDHRLVAESESGYDSKYCIDHIVMDIQRGTGGMGLSATQTLIKYNFCHGEDRVFIGEKTGIVEDSTMVFLHPPRNHFFNLLQMNPFPYVRFPFDEHTSWDMSFSIPDHAIREFPELTDTSMKIMYTLASRESDTGKFADSVFNYLSIAKSTEIETLSQYSFSKRYGFVKMRFTTFQGLIIQMTLEDIVKTRSL